MNIGVIGWWNNGNQGDFAILENLKRGLAPYRVVPIDVPFTITPDEIRRLNQLDFILFGGGGLIDPQPAVPFDTFDKWGADLRTPIGTIGLGVTAVLPQYEAAIRALLDRAVFAYVRDMTSQQLLNHPKVKLMPDVTFFDPPFKPDIRPHTLPARPLCGVNLRATASNHLVQWIETLQGLPIHSRGIPLATFSAFQELETLRQIDPDCAPTFNYALYDGLDVMLGMAFHAIVFAVQAAVPIIAIAYAPKVRRLLNELELGDYVLDLNERHRLPQLFEQIVSQHDQLASVLAQKAADLTRAARQAFADIRQQIEAVVQPTTQMVPCASLVVVAGDTAGPLQTTLASCVDQSYRNVEIIVVTDDARAVGHFSECSNLRVVSVSADAKWGERLASGLAQTSGEYISWILAGDQYAGDAIACLADRLGSQPECDLVYADYYAMHEKNLISCILPVSAASKLSRRNVIGPCFLMRHSLQTKVGPISGDVALPDYDYWLRARKLGILQPLHARLFYRLNSNASPNEANLERVTRHRRLAGASRPQRVLWSIVDTEFTERIIVRPMLNSLRRVKSLTKKSN